MKTSNQYKDPLYEFVLLTPDSRLCSEMKEFSPDENIKVYSPQYSNRNDLMSKKCSGNY